MDAAGWQILAAVGVPLISGIIALWIRAHIGQSSRIDQLAESNRQAHEKLHEKIDRLDNKAQHQHGIVRDKIERILEYLARDSK